MTLPKSVNFNLPPGNVNSTISTREGEEVVIVPPPQPVRLNIVTEQPQPRPVAYPVQSTVQLNYSEVKNGVYQRLRCVLLCTVLLAFFGTPLTLFATIPSLYCVYKVRIVMYNYLSITHFCWY